jgi:hypothetical protein
MAPGTYPDTLNHKHIAMVPLLSQPISNAQVVEVLAMQGVTYSENRISIIRNSPLMQELVLRYQAGMQAMMMAEQTKGSAQKLNEMVPAAIESLDELLRGATNESARLNAVKTVFDYAPEAPKATKTAEASPRVMISIGSDALKMVERALSETSDVIDVTPTQVTLPGEDREWPERLPSLDPQPAQPLPPSPGKPSSQGLISVEELSAALADIDEDAS